MLELAGYISLTAIALIGVICLAAIIVKPPHIRVRFTKRPPVVARVNTPSRDASELQRTVYFPTGDKYIIPSGTRGHFVMVFDWKVPVWQAGHSAVLTIPKLTTTDFASIPRALHSLLSPLNNTIYAAIVHDYLYRDPDAPEAAAITKEAADRILYWGMRARGVRRLTAGLMYLGVALGGHSSYKRSRRETGASA
jgi:hypothetical protein